MILIYILLGALILAIPDDSSSSPIPLPIEVFHHGFVRYNFTAFSDRELRRWVRPGEILPESAFGTITCYTDRYSSPYLLDGFQEIWEQLTPSGLLAINHKMAMTAQRICNEKWEDYNGPAIE